MSSTFGGDPDDTGFMPVSTTLLGAICTFLAAAFGGAFVVAGQLGGGGVGTVGFWILAGGVTLGVAMMVWDALTDFFAASAPAGGSDDEIPGDDESIDDLSDIEARPHPDDTEGESA